MDNYIKRIRSKFRNTAKLGKANPLAFNGHHVRFKVKPKHATRLGTLGEQLSYWKGQKRWLDLRYRGVAYADNYVERNAD